MKRLAAVLVLLVFPPSAHASEHLMQVNKVNASPGDVSKQFVELLDTAAALGPLLGEVRDAIQPGRRIGTIRREAGLGLPVAFLSARLAS